MRKLVLGLSILVLALLVLAACAKAAPTPTPTPPTPTPPTPTARPAATPTSAPGVRPTAAPTATLVPPTPTLSPAQATYEAARKNFETTVLPAALKEGTITWYTCHTADSAADMIKSFNGVYPGIKVEYVFESPGPLIERIKAESRAGKVVADVYNCGGTSGYILGWDGFAAEHTVPTALDPSIKWAGAMRAQDPSDTAKHYTHFAYAIGTNLINTDLVPKEHYPKSWWDYINDPWWTGKISMTNPFAPGYIGGFTYIWLHDPTLGEPFIKALSDKKPSIYKTGGADVIARGEIFTLIGGGASTPYIKPWKGAPIIDSYPKEGTYPTNFHATLVKGAPHPNAALVFLEGLLSKPVQEAVSRWGFTPLRGDVALAIPELSFERPGMVMAMWATPDKEKVIRTYYAWHDQKGFFK